MPCQAVADARRHCAGLISSVEKTGSLARNRDVFPPRLTDLNARCAALWPELRLQVEKNSANREV
jgi:hypothetical protein